MQTRIIVGGAIIFAAMLVMSVSTYFANQVAYHTVDDLVADADLYPAAGIANAAEREPAVAADGASQLVGPRMQVRGSLDKTTIDRAREGLEMRFTLTGKEGRIPVVYRGVVPDTFDLAESITVGGRVTADGAFVADELLVQCPSKYEAVPPGMKDVGGGNGEGRDAPGVGAADG